MTIAESNVCLEIFSELCEEIANTKIVDTEDCQYWLFERGYQAALAKLTQANHAVNH